MLKVGVLQQKGIGNKNVLEAIKKIPRHLFLNSSFEDFAYQDKAFPIDAGQTISQPYTVAFQTELLELKKGDKILEIGTGSGYQTCVLLEMGAKVFSIERQKELFDKIKARYDEQISPYYAASRLWTDAIIDPLETRNWISMGIEAANHAPIEKKFNLGVIQV